MELQSLETWLHHPDPADADILNRACLFGAKFQDGFDALGKHARMAERVQCLRVDARLAIALCTML